MFRKKYSTYRNPKSKDSNKKPVAKGSVVASKVSDLECKIKPGSKQDHNRESIVMMVGSNNDLGVVQIHGVKNIKDETRQTKIDNKLWQPIKKDGQIVCVDQDIRVLDRNNKPIRQGKAFSNTGKQIEPEEMSKVEKHVYHNSFNKNRGRQSKCNKEMEEKFKNKKKV